jgi:hypothetical protein
VSAAFTSRYTPTTVRVAAVRTIGNAMSSTRVASRYMPATSIVCPTNVSVA